MAFLKVNGVTVPVEDGAADIEELPIGDEARAFDGSFRSTVRTWKRQWNLRTPPERQADAEALKALIRGQGHALPFDVDLYTSKGVGPSTGGGQSAVIVTSGMKYGAGYARVDTFQNWASMNLPADWTLMVWKKAQTDAAPWEHWVLRSDGQKWKNGATTGESVNWMSVVGGGPRLDAYGNANNAQSWQANTAYSVGQYVKPTSGNPNRVYRCTTAGTTGGTEPSWPTSYGTTVNDNGVEWTDEGPYPGHFDDFVCLPFLVPTDWPSQVHADTRAFGALPKLTCSGDFAPAVVTAIGRVGSTRLLQFADGGWNAAGQAFDFSLMEA